MGELEKIAGYWGKRARGYSLKTQEDLSTGEADAWLEKLGRFLPPGEGLSVLDAGCGPGFFSILLARMGHHVTALDYSDEMLEQARENAARANVTLEFCQGDAQDLPFTDGQFALVVSRNLMWDLEHPEVAYAEWLRVLCPGGRLINCDGNHYRHLFDAAYAEAHARHGNGHDPRFLLGVDFREMDEIAARLPLGRYDRPAWDLECLKKLGADSVRAVYFPAEETSLVENFLLCAEKK